MPKGQRKEAAGAPLPSSDFTRTFSDTMNWWCFCKWLHTYQHLWLTSSTFKYGIAFMCAENLYAAFSLLSTAARFDETSISTWIKAYQTWGSIILRQLRIIKSAVGSDNFEVLQFHLWPPAMYPGMSRFTTGMLEVIHASKQPVTSANSFCYKFVQSLKEDPVLSVAGFDSNQVHAVVFKSNFTLQQRKKYFKMWFENSSNKPIFVKLFRQLLNGEMLHHELTRTVDNVLGSYARATNGKEIPTCGLFTYAGVYAEEVMNRASSYPENREPLHAHFYASAREGEVHYGLRHLSHAIVAVSLLHEAMRYARSDGSAQYQQFCSRVADCLSYTPLQYGQDLTITPPYPRFCDLLDAARPYAEKMEESIEAISKKVNNRGFTDSNIVQLSSNDDEEVIDASEKCTASTSKNAYKSKEFIEDTDESDDDTTTIKDNRSTKSNSPNGQGLANGDGKESAEKVARKHWKRIRHDNADPEDENSDKDEDITILSTPPSSQVSSVKNLGATAEVMQPTVAIQRITSADLVKAKNNQALIDEIFGASDSEEEEKDGDEDDFIEPSQLKKKLPKRKFSVTTQKNVIDDVVPTQQQSGHQSPSYLSPLKSQHDPVMSSTIRKDEKETVEYSSGPSAMVNSEISQSLQNTLDELSDISDFDLKSSQMHSTLEDNIENLLRRTGARRKLHNMLRIYRFLAWL
uniref:Uncharacterized protein n=1 Tax=Trichogramma kaykai TaxID=54128 RepID=A0ABD2W434_9HYME